MESAEKVMDDFLEEYDENPEGWSYWTDPSGEFYNIYILREDKGYFLKIDSIYTQNPMGVGTQINVEKEELEENLPGFGFRKFDEDELENFMYALSENEEDKEKTKKLISRKMNESPYPKSSLKDAELVMLGPFNRGRPFQNPSVEQQELDKELTSKLRKKFRKKNPMYR